MFDYKTRVNVGFFNHSTKLPRVKIGKFPKALSNSERFGIGQKFQKSPSNLKIKKIVGQSMGGVYFGLYNFVANNGPKSSIPSKHENT